MPPSGRRRARPKEPQHETETAEITTPSRKKRRVCLHRYHVKPLRVRELTPTQINGSNDSKAAPAASARAMRRASAESDETIENQVEDPEAENSTLYDEAEEIIRHLRVATYEVGVAIDHNNQVVEQSAQAFAKIAGRTWTYYVSNLSVIIGRPNVKSKSPGNAVGEAAHQDMQVDIDLGPDQQVSRLHAEIAYDQEREQWFVIVNGRNGLVVDEHRLERGEKLYLRSGNVITVLGTQMMFMLPNEPPLVHHVIRKTLLAEEDDEEADMADEKPLPYSGSFKPRGRPSAAQQQSSSQPARPPPQQSSTRAAQTLAALSSSQPMPGTPLQRNLDQPQPKSKPSPAYARGLTLESTEEVDYSADSAKDIKPPHSYAQMIGQAIMSSQDENATLSRIYDFIKEKYAFFRFGGGGWQNSIRHNLSLSKHFEKIPRRTDEPGKGMKWQIVPDHRAEYMKKNFHDNRRAVRRIGSSSPRSPAANTGPSTQTERLLGAMQTGATTAERQPPRSTTPPLTGFSRQPFPAQTESFTPDRGPRPGNLQTSNLPNGNGIGSESAHSESFTPTFDRGIEPPQSALAHRGPTSASLDGTNETAVDSPTAFRHGNGAYDVAATSHLFTPMPQRMAPKQTMLSTIKAPSHYARELFSSPAPFWKYVDLGSTPPRPQPNFMSSPEKRAGGDIDEDGDDDEDEDEESAIATACEKKEEEEEGMSEPVGAQPSSPPPAHIGSEGPDESPSRTISRPVSRRDGPPVRGLEPMPKFAPPAQPKFGLNPSINGPAFSLYSNDVNADDDDEEKGIDLAK
ncbi:hypothetical protein E2P81_ATG02480 [Venturia nashicola]|uniref:Uncharacterized protein n=1 Tax=Venturia nashicola TaxID=86259 RepID=A0A4Z1PP38_9PEZI|nr:hypothetical protein E6O75_ATG02539 [Venturia nashicola]TLD36698.1 hypothetical protein E2P81_ATG02480 [Venturia nashicola]